MTDLDDAYDNVGHIPDAASFPPRWAAQAEAFRAQLGDRALLDLPYGPGARQRYDLFRPEGAARGLLVFVHGGYWLRFGRQDWSAFAAGGVARGWAVMLPSYTLCPEARIAEITQEIALAVTAAAGGVEGPVSLAGHSAGGQLVCRMLEPGLLPPEVAARLHAVLPVSPVGDLRPLMHTAMQESLRLTGEEVARESPVLMTERLDVPVQVRVGALERPPFLRDAAEVARVFGGSCDVVAGRHHFDVIDALADPDSVVLQALCP